MTAANRIRIAGWGAAALLLALPWAAMQAGAGGFAWSGFDFLVAGAMLGAAGLALELGLRARQGWAYRAGVALAVLAAFLLVWINLAVGIIGSEDHPANLMYLGVLILAGGGALFAGGRPGGMAGAMAAAAAAQVAAGVVGAVWLSGPASPPAEILGATAMFTALWLGAAALFWKSARA